MSCDLETRLVMLEGLPGSGKTSAARHLCRSLRSKGIAARWLHELAPDHPAIPRSVFRLASRDDYGQLCLDRWDAFVAGCAPGEVVILEGCVLQSTVRFLFAKREDESLLCDYWEGFEKRIAPLSPRLVYLYQDDPAEFMRSRTLVRRGAEWVEKLAHYAAGTPLGRARGWEGEDGLVAFWMEYRAACDDLYQRSSSCKLALENTTQLWSQIHLRIAERVMDPAPQREPDWVCYSAPVPPAGGPFGGVGRSPISLARQRLPGACTSASMSSMRARKSARLIPSAGSKVSFSRSSWLMRSGRKLR